MKILKEEIHRIFDPVAMLTLMGEDMLERIIEDPNQPLMENEEKGFSYEVDATYDTKVSFIDICKEGQANGAKRLDVYYDFFFGGDSRENYPDSPMTIKAYKVIHDIAKEYGMNLGASIVSPLDIGGGYVQTHEKTGQCMQFQEGMILEDGTYQTDMDFQTQWTNNKGPAKVKLHSVKAFAFEEERIGDTAFYYVNENEIVDISDTVEYQVDQESIHVSKEGYGHGNIRISGKTSCGKNRFLAVVIYDTLEVDYFAEDALDYMKSIIDLHKEAGITYDGIYSDEMHIQFDWDRIQHWAETEVTARYMTDSMARTYAAKYGAQYEDFAKYLVYFTYMHHDFLGDGEGRLPAQHVMGKNREDIVRTWKFRKDYFELLHRQVVDLCRTARDYAKELYGHDIVTTGHSTWEESPTCDAFYRESDYEDPFAEEHSLYDYTPEFVWSAANRENISACNDHFKWNEYFWAVGTDIPEGGYLDRNYYGAAYTSGLAALNPFGYAYYCIWGSPDQIKERQMEIGQTYGHYAYYSKSHEWGHYMIQGYSARISDVLTVCPMDLNYLEERFGNWTVQYGYTDYITEEKLLEYAGKPDGEILKVNGRGYRALVVLFAPLMSAEALKLLKAYAEAGGKVIWCSMPALQQGNGELELWKQIFGVGHLEFENRGLKAGGMQIRFDGLENVEDMPILTDLFPDHVYPVCAKEGMQIASLAGKTVGTMKQYPGGGKALYLGFRVRDDQSGSTGEDIHTLFSVLCALGAYEEKGCEISSRPAESRYLYNRFPNGAVTLCNHFRNFRELGWRRTFYRDEEIDNQFMQSVELPDHSICLDEAELSGHKVTYRGEGIVTYMYNDEEGLCGLVGRNTQGIRIDGREYCLTKEPVNIVWGRLPENVLDEEIQQAYVVKCSKAVEMRLPFDAAGMKCVLCKNHVLDMEKEYSYATEEGSTVVTVDADTVEKWIVFYK